MEPEQAYTNLTLALCRISNISVRSLYLRFHEAQKANYMALPASVKKHHCWPGGYAVHIDEVVTNLLAMLDTLPVIVDFTLDDAITAAYVHDIDKLLYRYEETSDPASDAQVRYARQLGIQNPESHNKNSLSLLIDAAKNGKKVDVSRLPKHDYRKEALSFDDGALVKQLCCEHQLDLSYMALHAICWHHGGWAPIAQSGRQGLSSTKPLGALLHAADFISASAQMGDRNLRKLGGANV